MKLHLVRLKLRIAVKSIVHVLKDWRYALVVIIVSFLFLGFMYWAFNASLFWYLLSSANLTITDKVSIIWSSTTQYVTSLSAPQAIATILLVIGQGIVIAMLIYSVRSRQKLDSHAFGGSAIAAIIAMFSVGCVSCGTSIIAPVVSLFFASAAASISKTINSIAIYASLIIVLYALYAVGATTATYIVRMQSEHN